MRDQPFAIASVRRLRRVGYCSLREGVGEDCRSRTRFLAVDTQLRSGPSFVTGGGDSAQRSRECLAIESESSFRTTNSKERASLVVPHCKIAWTRQLVCLAYLPTSTAEVTLHPTSSPEYHLANLTSQHGRDKSRVRHDRAGHRYVVSARGAR